MALPPLTIARCWVAVLVLAALAHCAGAMAQAVRVDTVDLLVVPAAGEFKLPAADAAWSPVTLPEIVRHDARGGVVWRWYRVRSPAPFEPPQGLYVPRLVGGIDDPRYFANGQRLQTSRGGYGTGWWNRPEFVQIPGARDERLPEILMAVRLDTRLGMGLAPVWVGASADVAALFARAEYARVILPQTIALALLMVGGLALAYWLGRPREVAYLLFALATIAWFVRTLHFWVDEPVIGDAWHFWLHVNALTLLMALVYAYAFRLLARRFGGVEVTLLVLVAVVAVLTLPDAFGHAVLTSTVAYALQSVIAVGVTVLITWSAAQRRDLEVAVLAASLWLNLALGVHDLLLKEMLIDIERVYLLPYGGVAIFAAFLYSAQRRFLAAVTGIERSNVELEQRVRERTDQLQAAFARLRGLERERAQAEERQRLMREMHDGLGSSLMSTLALVEQGKMDMPAVSQVLRECVDDLKLTMDSMEPIDGDLATLLATLRYRVGRRLEAAGLSMHWQVDDLPPLPWLDSAAALQVLRILQEALTNVIKHAQATSITVTTSVEGDRVKVCVDDNGRGLPAAAPADGAGGRGLRNMRRRAEEIGARLAIESRTPGARVALSLPLEREPRVKPERGEAAADN